MNIELINSSSTKENRNPLDCWGDNEFENEVSSALISMYESKILNNKQRKLSHHTFKRSS